MRIKTLLNSTFLFVLSYCVFFANISYAENSFEKPMLRLNSYSYEQGLSHSSIQSIIQDEKGYMWLGTHSGLNRFNGKDFVQFFPDKNDPYAVKDKLVSFMFKDENKRIWLTSLTGISYIDSSNNKFINLPLFNENNDPLNILNISQTNKNKLWLNGSSSLWSFDTITHELTKIDGLSSSLIMYIVSDDDKSLWVGTNQGVFRKKFSSPLFEKIKDFPLLGEDILDMTESNGTLWVVTKKELLKLSLHDLKWKFENFNTLIKPLEIQKIVFNKDGAWLSSMNGLWFKSKNCSCWHQYIADPIIKNALPVSQMLPLYFDNQDQLWIGTIGGGVSVRNPKHQVIKHWLNSRQLSNHFNSLFFSNTDVTDVNPDGKGSLLVSTGDKGVFQLSQSGSIEKHYSKENTPQMVTNDINQVVLDLHQRLWMSSYPEGVLMRTSEGEWYEFNTDENGLKNMQHEYVFEIYEDRTGQIWVGTLAGSKVYKPETNSFHSMAEQYPSSLSESNSRTNVIRQAMNGYYWLGTEGGLIVLDEKMKFHKIFSYLEKSESIMSNEINDIAEDSAGNIWLATGSGLNKISKTQGQWKVTSFEEHSLLSEKSLMTVLIDLNGIVWVAGNSGLIRFDPSSEKLIVIPTNYGLQSQEFSPSASYQDGDGYLYFAGANGLNQLHYEFLPSADSNVPIFLAEVKADGVSVTRSINDKYLIPAQTRFTRFYFDILDLSSSAIYELRIRIPEHSDSWLPWSEQRYFDFFDMPTGNITLEIQSRNKSGSKVMDEKSFSLHVESFYSWYDYLFWLGLFLTTFFSFLYMRKKLSLWKSEKTLLIQTQLKLIDSISDYKSKLSERDLETEQLLDEIAISINQNQLLESQLSDIHLVDKQTGLHTKDFIKLSIDNATQQLEELYNNNENSIDSLPQLLFLIIKLDDFEALRLEGGQFLLNQIIIQIAAEIKKVNANTDELVRWNKDSFLLYSRSEDKQKLIRKCNRITDIINQGMFGPSEDEKLKITCSIGVVKYPFYVGNYNQIDWTMLLDMATAAASQLNDNGGNGWVIISENAPNLNEGQIELIINDFDSAVDKQLISVTSSKS